MTGREIAMVLAVDETGGIGCNGKLPKWNNRDDLEFFKTLTTYHTVIMGATTYYSLPEKNRPLTMRYNVVITRDPSKYFEINSFVRFTTATTMPELTKSLPYFYKKKIFVIGGAQIYDMLADQCNTMYVTYNKGDYNCTTKLDIKKYTSNYLKETVLVEKATYKIVKYTEPKSASPS